MILRIPDKLGLPLKHFPIKGQLGRKEPLGPLIYECTTDRHYLRQYFALREYVYRMDLHLKHFSGEEDEIDKYSHILVVRRGHECIGGARLTVSTPSIRLPLPLESETFNVMEALPELRPHSFCELGRLAILADYRNQGCLEGIFELAADMAKDLGCTYMMGVSPPTSARKFANTYRELGYESQIREDIVAPIKAIHEHLELQFILVKLTEGKG